MSKKLVENGTFLKEYFVSVDRLKLLSFHDKILQNVQIWYKAIKSLKFYVIKFSTPLNRRVSLFQR